MKTKFTFQFVAVFFATVFLFQKIVAQTPGVVANIDIPTGNADAKGIAYGNGVYVTILSRGWVYKSTDGNNWRKVTDAGIPTATFYSLTFANGLFVGVGTGGTIFTSANGQNWTVRTSGTTESLIDVKYIAGKFYAVGYQNFTLLTSADGISWAPVTINGGNGIDKFLNLSYGNGQFIIAALNPGVDGCVIYQSASAANGTWTRRLFGTGTLNKIQYLKDRFFAFLSGHHMYSSTDGVTWPEITNSMTQTLPDATPSVWNANNQIFNGVYDGTNFYFYGCSQFYGYGTVWVSSTGTDLALQIRSAYIVPGGGSAIVNGKYFVFGNEGIVSSTNGIVYKYPSGTYTSVASSGTSYVGIGSIGQTGIIFSSPDFNTWSEKTPVGTKELSSVIYDGSRYVATGNNTVVASTDNGNTWSTISTPAYNFNAMGYGASAYVAAGVNASYESRIAYSADGITWTDVSVANNYYFKIKYVNGIFFALGYDNTTTFGVIMQSADGISWQDITPATSYDVVYYNDVVYDGTAYHFMGMEWVDPNTYAYDDFFSLSTQTPSDPNSFTTKGQITNSPMGVKLGGSYGEGAFAYSNGHFVGAVNDIVSGKAYIIFSQDGVSWTAMDAEAYTYIYGIVAEGDKFRLMGMYDGKFTADYSSVLLPVTMTQFTAKLVNDQTLLQWQTASEQNSHHFIVQSSTDATNWNNIGTVMAAGQSSTVQNYQFTHIAPQKGYNYYRIAQVDIDSKQQLSAIKQIFIGKTISMSMYPNPATDNVQLQLPSGARSTVTIINAGGQQVYQKTFSENIISVSVQQLSKGIYQVVVNQDGQRYTQTLSKQ